MIYNQRPYLKNTGNIMLPFGVLLVYIIVTMLLSFFGPVQYQYYSLYNKFIVFIYITLFLIITWGGMVSSVSYMPRKVWDFGGIQEKKILRFISICIFLEFIIKLMLVISSIQLIGLPSVKNISVMLAEVYSNLHHGEVIYNPFRRIDTLTTFLFYISLFGGFFVRKKLRLTPMILLYSIIILDLFYNIGYIGTLRGLFTYFIFFLVLYVTSILREKKQINFRSFFKTSLGLIAGVLVIMNLLGARYKYWGRSESRIQFANGVSYDLSNFLLYVFPDHLRYEITSVISYLSQGYYGLSLSLTMPFQWTFGLGSSRGLNSIISDVFPSVSNITSYVYPVRAEYLYGFKGLANWHTIFPWLAGDFTFIGALLYMGLVGKIFIKCWKQVIVYNNAISFILLVLLTIQYIFVPANNQLFIGRGESLATIIIFIIWLFNNGRFNFNESKNSS